MQVGSSLEMVMHEPVAGQSDQENLRTLTSQKARHTAAVQGGRRRRPSMQRDGVERSQENVTRKNYNLHLRSCCTTLVGVPETGADRLMLFLVHVKGVYFLLAYSRNFATSYCTGHTSLGQFVLFVGLLSLRLMTDNEVVADFCCAAHALRQPLCND